MKLILLTVLIFSISCALTESKSNNEKLTNSDCEYMQNTAKDKGHEYDC